MTKGEETESREAQKKAKARKSRKRDPRTFIQRYSSLK